MPEIQPFNELGLDPALLTTLNNLGYELPTPVQAESIPHLLEGYDILAQAQTGTGKTAAFALPALSKIDTKLQATQVIVIAPTRELAIQVAEAFQSYAKHIKDFLVAPIYGGQEYRTQLRALKRGAHVVVGTPGRVMDHMRRGSMNMDNIRMVVLDEADEMLKMGFIDDIEWILEQIPGEHQTALFSATMPPAIQKISQRYLKNAKHVHINPTENTVDAIEQSYMRVLNHQKMDILTSYLEVEDFDAAIIFTRTKIASDELADKLLARGYSAAALNGDIKQSVRKQVIDKIKAGQIDIIVATDVAARGLDVQRMSHVINYDIPHDTESYIHRIGRTGRAGRKGKALLMITPREQRLLKDIEHAVKQSIPLIEPPSRAKMRDARSQQLATKVAELSADAKKLGAYRKMIDSVMSQTDSDAVSIAAALAYMLQESNPLPTQEFETPDAEHGRGGNRKGRHRKGGGGDRSRDRSGFKHRKSNADRSASGGKDDRPWKKKGPKVSAGDSKDRKPWDKSSKPKAGGKDGGKRPPFKKPSGGGSSSFKRSEHAHPGRKG